MKPYYDEDGVTIYHADCRAVLPQLEAVDLLLTDPPYGIGFAADPTNYQRRRGQKPERWDDVAPTEIVLNLVDLGRKAVIWGGNYFPLPLSRGWLTWFKPDAPPSMASIELAWTSLDQNSRQISHSISRTNAERVGHPTQKPLAVIKWSIVQVGVTSGCVLDPFMGSGTTLRAAKDMGLRAVGVEIEGRYCEMAARRLRQQVLFGIEEGAAA